MQFKNRFIAPLAAVGLLTACETMQKPEVQAYSTEAISAVSTETREKAEVLREFSAWKDEIEQYAQSIKNPEKSAHENVAAIISYANTQSKKYPFLTTLLEKRIQVTNDWFLLFAEFGYFINFMYHTDQCELLNHIDDKQSYSIATLSPELQKIVPPESEPLFFVNSQGKWTTRSVNKLNAFNITEFNRLFTLLESKGLPIGEKHFAQEAEVLRRMGSYTLEKSPYFLTSYNWESFAKVENIQTGIQSNKEAAEFLLHSSMIQKSPASLYKVLSVILSNRTIYREKMYVDNENLVYLQNFLAQLLEERKINADQFIIPFEEKVLQNHKNETSEQEIQLSKEEEKLLEDTVISILQKLSPEDIAYVQAAFSKESQRIIDFMKAEYRPLYNPDWVDEQRGQLTNQFPGPIEAKNEKEQAIDNFAMRLNTHIQNTKLEGVTIRDYILEQIQIESPEDFKTFFENISDTVILRKKFEDYFAQYNYFLNFDYQQERTDFFVKAHSKMELQYNHLSGIQKLFPKLEQKTTTLFTFPGNNKTPIGFHTDGVMGLNLGTLMSYYKKYYSLIPNIPPWASHGADNIIRGTIANELVHDILHNEYHFSPKDPGFHFNFQGKPLEITALHGHEFLSDVGSLNTFPETEVVRMLSNTFGEIGQLKKENGVYTTNMNHGYGFTNLFMIERLREIMNKRGENIDPILDEIAESNYHIAITLDQNPELESEEEKKRETILNTLLRKIKKSDIIFLQANFLAAGKKFVENIKSRKQPN